jgi:hypothetical protein
LSTVKELCHRRNFLVGEEIQNQDLHGGKNAASYFKKWGGGIWETADSCPELAMH